MSLAAVEVKTAASLPILLALLVKLKETGREDNLASQQGPNKLMH